MLPSERPPAPMLRTALLILSGNAAASLLLLARNLVVARLIPVADYGVAATFAVAMAVVEMVSALGLQQQIVQAKEGDDPHFQAALQGFQVLRGAATGAILFLLAGPMAAFLGIPEAVWAYQVLAVVPVLNALQHFDVHRLNRQMIFGPLILSKAAPAILSLVALWPLACWFGDWQVMLWSILVQAATGALASHLVAKRPYRLLFDRTIMAQSFRFGWPLLVNGGLMFFVFQGDKLIIGRELGMEALALFAMGMTLTLTPTLVIAGSVSDFFLPQLVAARSGSPGGSERFQQLAMVVFQLHFLCGVVFVLGVLACGGPITAVLLGAKYEGIVPILFWLAILQALRVFKGGPSTVALARGKTENAMLANLVRVGLLPLAWFFAVQTGAVWPVIGIALIGEAAGFCIALLLAQRRVCLSLRPLLWSITSCLMCLVFGGLAAWNRSFPDSVPISFTPLSIIVCLTGAALLSIWTMRDLRTYLSMP